MGLAQPGQWPLICAGIFLTWRVFVFLRIANQQSLKHEQEKETEE